MNRKFMLFGICFLLWSSVALPAQDLARLPYEMIYHMEKVQASLTNNFTNLNMYLRMTPTAPGVKISDVDVYIHSKAGRIPIPLNPTNGTFKVPMRESLVQEQAWIVANQPKGTMNFQWYIGLEGEEMPSNGIHYRALMRPLQAVEIIRDEMAKVPGAPPLTIAGMKMLYAKAKDATVVVHSQSGDKTFKTDDSHTLVVPLKPEWMAEDPPVSLTSPPDKVFVADAANDK